ncbi:MAG: hypothetical protein ABFC90_07345 [Bacteroidales bacterium]|nr:hypothetical protein [Bacteroidales bacterium]
MAIIKSKTTTAPEDRIKFAQRALLNKEITITWETDPKQFDFSKLRGFEDGMFQNKNPYLNN